MTNLFSNNNTQFSHNVHKVLLTLTFSPNRQAGFTFSRKDLRTILTLVAPDALIFLTVNHRGSVTQWIIMFLRKAGISKYNYKLLLRQAFLKYSGLTLKVTSFKSFPATFEDMLKCVDLVRVHSFINRHRSADIWASQSNFRIAKLNEISFTRSMKDYSLKTQLIILKLFYC